MPNEFIWENHIAKRKNSNAMRRRNFACTNAFQVESNMKLPIAAEVIPMQEGSVLLPKPATSRSWRDFDIDAFLEKEALAPGEDPYSKKKFNRTASDEIVYNRQLPDARPSQ